MTRKPKVGDIVQFSLPDGRYAYARVLHGATAAFYSTTTDEPGKPPIGERTYQFIVGVYDEVYRSPSVTRVGYDPGIDEDDDWGPPAVITDPINGRKQIYDRGVIRDPRPGEQTEGLETAAVWALNHLVDRLMGNNKWT